MDHVQEAQTTQREIVKQNVEFVKALYCRDGVTQFAPPVVQLRMVAHNPGELY
jgi:hypothetical protein